MLGLSSSLGHRLALGALILSVGCCTATAQGASPPPAVSVSPVVSRRVTETGDFIGRVMAIDKGDVAACVANCPFGNLLQPSEPDIPQ